jgi:xylulose-5-phosphate/fructose-6-phosphate phosphoketolase
MACAGDVPTLEALAAVDLLRQRCPDLAIRVVNVVDLMSLQPAIEHPHGLTEASFDAMFTRDRPVIFAYHGYPALIHRLCHRRANYGNFHVHGYREEGTTTTPFDMTVLNGLDRYHLAFDAVQHVPRLASVAPEFRGFAMGKLRDHRAYILEHGDDPPEIRDWKWPY